MNHGIWHNWTSCSTQTQKKDIWNIIREEKNDVNDQTPEVPNIVKSDIPQKENEKVKRKKRKVPHRPPILFHNFMYFEKFYNYYEPAIEHTLKGATQAQIQEILKLAYNNYVTLNSSPNF